MLWLNMSRFKGLQLYMLCTQHWSDISRSQVTAIGHLLALVVKGKKSSSAVLILIKIPGITTFSLLWYTYSRTVSFQQSFFEQALKQLPFTVRADQGVQMQRS